MMRRILVLLVAAAAVGASGVVASACSSAAQEATPSRPVIPQQPDSSTVNDAGDVDGEAAVVDPGCIGPDSCFKCAPVKLDDYLNACTDGQCTPFDNVARLPLFKAGQPLPPVP